MKCFVVLRKFYGHLAVGIGSVKGHIFLSLYVSFLNIILKWLRGELWFRGMGSSITNIWSRNMHLYKFTENDLKK